MTVSEHLIVVSGNELLVTAASNDIVVVMKASAD